MREDAVAALAKRADERVAGDEADDESGVRAGDGSGNRSFVLM